MEPILMIITLLLLAAMALAGCLLVYWVLYSPLPGAHPYPGKRRQRTRPSAGKERRP